MKGFYPPYSCPYCGRVFHGGKQSRGAHVARCPALRLVPNEVKKHRGMLTYLKGRLLLAATDVSPVTKGAAKRLVKEIDRSLKIS